MPPQIDAEVLIDWAPGVELRNSFRWAPPFLATQRGAAARVPESAATSPRHVRFGTGLRTDTQGLEVLPTLDLRANSGRLEVPIGGSR